MSIWAWVAAAAACGLVGTAALGWRAQKELRAELVRASGVETAFQAGANKLRHDVRGILAPALLVADQLSLHKDAEVAKAAQKLIEAIERAAERLKEG